MIQLITPDRYGAFLDELGEMHRLRYRIFKERLGWDVEVSGDMEIDARRSPVGRAEIGAASTKCISEASGCPLELST
jgi:hypothetical protein